MATIAPPRIQAPTGRVAAPERPRRTEPRIAVTLSDLVDDVDRALAVVHRGFVQAGYMSPRPSGRRMHPAYLNPGTVFAVAEVDGEAGGSVAMVADGPFGLPSDRAFVEEIDALRADGPVHEVGGLAIDLRWRRHTRRIYLHMLATMVHTALRMDPRTAYVLSVTPENARFTGGLFDCEVLGEARPLYGAPAVLLVTDGARLRDCYTDPHTPTRREMARLALCERPDWLRRRVSGTPLPRSWWGPLLEEDGTASRMRAQAAVLAGIPVPG